MFEFGRAEIVNLSRLLTRIGRMLIAQPPWTCFGHRVTSYVRTPSSSTLFSTLYNPETDLIQQQTAKSNEHHRRVVVSCTLS